jgi:hypothetical protein
MVGPLVGTKDGKSEGIRLPAPTIVGDAEGLSVVGAIVGAVVLGAGVSDSVGFIVGGNVGPLVGATVVVREGALVGLRVGGFVGKGVGAGVPGAIGALVGAATGALVGTATGGVVGTTVPIDLLILASERKQICDRDLASSPVGDSSGAAPILLR